MHVAGIEGASTVTLFLLQAGADPDVRSTYQYGLRMHPLSWNVYGGHVKNVQLLLDFGADPNLDVDSMERNGNDERETVLEIVQRILKAFEDDNNNNKEDDARYNAFREIQRLLLERGAKRYAELSEEKRSNEL